MVMNPGDIMAVGVKIILQQQYELHELLEFSVHFLLIPPLK